VPALERQLLFKNDRDHEHFIELLARMVERYSIILHAHVEKPEWLHCEELWRRGSAKGEGLLRGIQGLALCYPLFVHIAD